MRVINERDTLLALKAGRSLGRFGDAELKLSITREHLFYQDFDERLQQKMLRVLASRDPDFMVAIPNIYNGLDHLNSDWTNKTTWSLIAKATIPLFNALEVETNLATPCWYSSFVTRPEMVHGLHNANWFQSFQELWQDREILLMGNPVKVSQPGWNVSYREPDEILQHPLFANACQRHFRESPKQNAFAQYEHLLAQCRAFDPQRVLILLSLGPTSTVLAYDLFKLGYQAIDLGQLIMSHDFLLENLQPKYLSEQAWQQQCQLKREQSLGIRRQETLQTQHALLQALLPELKNKLVFDIGANVGLMTKLYKSMNARVVAVEPQAALTENNPAFLGVQVENCCLSDQIGQLPFYRCNRDTLSSCSREWQEGLFKDEATWQAPQMLPCTTLDFLIAKYGKPKYIKIDVENYEDRVLAGLTQPVELLSFEYTGGYQVNFENCLTHIEHLGCTELIAFELVKHKQAKYCQIIELTNTSAARAYFQSLPRYQQGDLLVVNRAVP